MLHFVFQYIGSDRGEIRFVGEAKIGLGKIDIVDHREGKHRIEIGKDGARLSRLGAKYALLADERSDPRQLLVVELRFQLRGGLAVEGTANPVARITLSEGFHDHAKHAFVKPVVVVSEFLHVSDRDIQRTGDLNQELHLGIDRQGLIHDFDKLRSTAQDRSRKGEREQIDAFAGERCLDLGGSLIFVRVEG